MTTIGKNYETTLQYINDPNKSEYFVADANSSMSCEQLQANADKLTQQMEFWTNAINELKFGLFSGDQKAAANISKIMDNQGAKLTKYTEYLAACATGGEPGTGTTTTPLPTNQQPTVSNGNNTWMYLLLAGGGLYLFTRKKKKRRKK